VFAVVTAVVVVMTVVIIEKEGDLWKVRTVVVVMTVVVKEKVREGTIGEGGGVGGGVGGEEERGEGRVYLHAMSFPKVANSAPPPGQQSGARHTSPAKEMSRIRYPLRDDCKRGGRWGGGDKFWIPSRVVGRHCTLHSKF
jgi:hypothetical protein